MSTDKSIQPIHILTTKRGSIKGQITRFSTFIATFHDSNRSITDLKTRLERIEQLWAEFDQVQTEIEVIDNTGAQEEREAFEDNFYNVICKAKDIIRERSSADSSAQPVRKKYAKLPAIPLPTFSGDYRDWPRFQNSFTDLVNDDTSLSNAQRFHYLLDSLQGEARKVIESIEITDKNYKTAFDLLRERYDNKKLIKKAHVVSLFDIQPLAKESFQGLRKFVNEINVHLRALKNYGESVETWDILLIHLIVSKLDPVTKRDWESHTSKLEDPKMEDIMRFLREKCNLLETLESSNHNNKNVKFGTKKNNESYSLVTSQNFKCAFCKGAHTIYNCKNFLEIPVKSRFDEIKKLKLCTNCLRSGHFNSECRSTSCKICDKRHNSLLHIDDNKTQSQTRSVNNSSRQDTPQDNSQQKNNSSTSSDLNSSSINVHTNIKTEPHVLLSTALIYVQDKQGNLVQCRALLDNGSQSNFITKDLCSKLKLSSCKVNIPVTGIGEASTNIFGKTQTVIKSMHNSYQKQISLLIINRITDNIPFVSFDYSNLNIPENLTLADPTFNISNQIDLLLGADVFWELLCIGQIRTNPDKPILQKSKLGWIISGPVQLNLGNFKTNCNLSTQGLQNQLEKFWNVEEFNNQRKLSPEESECERIFQETTKRDKSGRFIVYLPQRDFSSHVDFGNSRDNAEKRFLALEKRLKYNSDMKQKYTEFMGEYQLLGHMTKLDENEINNTLDTINNARPVYYLPHHGVQKESSLTTKLRVVFDASAKTETGLSLNDILLTGPTIQDDLFSILVRFRKHAYVIISDIAKMYRQILVTEGQRDMQRILWREQPDQPLQEYRLNTVTYGTSPASFIATRCLHELAFLNQAKYPQSCQAILKDFYMDDLITGADSVSETIKLKREISAILERGGFQLRKWVTNNPEILEEIKDTKINLPQYIISDEWCIKTLGLTWNAQNDSFQITANIQRDNRVITKRTILGSIAQIFDPLGLVGPITIKGKILMQRLWQLQVEWDESVPSDIYTEWCQFIDQIHLLSNLKIPRHISLPNPVDIQVHTFCDASEAAYGACIYLRTINFKGENFIRLICAKSRVAPVKALTLPRLELCGAVLAAQLTNKVVDSLNMKISKTYFWCDSTIVLSWLSAPSTQWKTFVCNRVAEIQRLTNISQWKHVRSNENPADIISRGQTPEKLLNCQLWWTGPAWLADSPEHWDVNYEPLVENIPEIKPTKIITLNTTFDNEIFTKYSSLTKLKRIIAYCLRFKFNALNKPNKLNGPLTSDELNRSMNVLLKLSQETEFSEEITNLKRNNFVSKGSKLASLNPFLDKEGLIRVGGRISKSNVTFDQKYPIVLSSKHILTKLIVMNEHIRNFHSGLQLTLSMLRLTYWPLKGRSTVRKILHECIVCFRAKPCSSYPFMADLPEHRVQPARPFYNCGVDFAGPFFIKDGKTRNRKIIKCYLCIFICFATKAVHLELAGDLSTNSFLNALKRFVSRRGMCKNLYSDNATNFRGARNELKETTFQLLKNHNDNNINNFLSDNNIIWHFIPAKSPHMGGLWEAAVKSAKFHAKRIIGDAHLTYEDLSTVFAQIEAILNSRPITPLTNDPTELIPLTPSHFLIGDVINAIPQVDLRNIPTNRLSHYQRLQQMVQHFWRRWSSEYLSTLQNRPKWRRDKRNNFQVGDMVVLKEENSAPMNWPLGRVIELFPGSDGVVRVVRIKTSRGEVKRAIAKICKLPIESEIKGDNTQGN